MRATLSRCSRRRFLAGAFAAAMIGAAPPATGQSFPARGQAERMGPGEATSPLIDLLAIVPRAVSHSSTTHGVLWQFYDLERQFAALGVDHPSEGTTPADSDVIAATAELTLASPAFEHAQDPAFLAALGFNPFGMKQALVAGPPWGRVTIFRGDFNHPTLITAWENAGFEEVVTVNGVRAWSIGVAGQIVAGHPLQPDHIVEFNNVTLVDDLIVWGNMLPVLDLVTSHLECSCPSALGDPATADLVLTLPQTTVSAIGVAPEAIGLPDHLEPSDLESELNSIRERLGPMPPLLGAVVAVNARASGDVEQYQNGGEALLRVQFESPTRAGQAVEVFSLRWAQLDSLLHHEPYASLMTMAAATSSGPVAAFDFTQMATPTIWRDLLLEKDLLPLLPDMADYQPSNWA